MPALFKELAARVTQAILNHRLPPGTKLGERELAEALGGSRIVVRQALIQLVEDGLVVIERNRGAFVAKPSGQDVIDIYEALILLEKGVIETLCERISVAGVAELRAHVERQQKATHDSNDTFADHLGTEFHSLMVKLSRNRILIETHATIVRRSRLLQALYPRDFDYCRLCDEHRKLVLLIEKRQARRAQTLLEEHYRLIVRGFHMEEVPLQTVSLADALAQ